MKLWCYTHTGAMAVDNLGLIVPIDVLDQNVFMVLWDGAKGEVEYWSHIGLRHPLTSPLAPIPLDLLINNFLEVADVPFTDDTMVHNGITVEAARVVKVALCDAIYESHRIMPIKVTVGAGTYLWDADTEAVAALQSALLELLADSILNPINGVQGAFNTLATSINSNVVAPLKDGEAAIGTAHYNIIDIAEAASGFYLTRPGANPTDHVAKPPANVSAPTLDDPTFGAIDWLPHEATATVELDVADIRAILAAIVARRNALKLAYNQKLTALNGLSTVPGIIAYNVATGWGAPILLAANARLTGAGALAAG